MATRLDGIGDKTVESKVGRFVGHLLKEAYHQAGVKWEQGWIELGNAMYQGTPVPMPQAITTNQIDIPPENTEALKQYEATLTQASQRAHEHQPQTERER